jgi:plasmid stabilization system protein ParE
MVIEKYILVWTKESSKQLKAIFEFISEDSPKNAFKVIIDIATSAENLISNPQFFPPDKYKINNDGSFRAFEKHHYRISYKFSKRVIRVLNVRHIKMEPKLY